MNHGMRVGAEQIEGDDTRVGEQIWRVDFAIVRPRATSVDKHTHRSILGIDEMIAVLIDGDGAVLQMRSVPPSDEGDQALSYYEILVRQDGLSLKRYTSVGSLPRQPEEMTITHELLGRIFTDFAAAHRECLSGG